MAEANILGDQEQFNCTVCLDLLKDPVTIPCGHNYCKRCITGCWNQEDQKGNYSCPLCKQTFTPRPVLGKNVVIAEMVEKLKTTRLQAAFPAVHHSGSGDVQCDSCTRKKQKAVQSCLECRSSYCQNHLEQHESLFSSKKHNLMDATGRLQEMICPQHDKILEVYCRTDQQCICMLCMVDEHKNHDTVSTAAERKEKQRHFEETMIKIQTITQQRRKELREAVESHKCSAQTAVEDSERIFTELIRSIEKHRSEVTQLIRDQERAAVSRAKEQLERLEQEINDLRRKDAELKQLLETQNHVHFLQSWSSVLFSRSTDGVTVSSHLSFDDVMKSVSQLRDKLQQFCSEETEEISKRVKTIQVIVPHEHATRKGLQCIDSSDDSIVKTEEESLHQTASPGLSLGNQPQIRVGRNDKLLWICAFIVFLASVVCPELYWHFSDSTPPALEKFKVEGVFNQEMEKLMTSFPNQRPELWKRSLSHLGHHLTTEHPTEPVSLILTSGRMAERTLGCLAQCLSQAYSIALNSSVLNINGKSKASKDSDQVKQDIDSELKKAFEGETCAAVIHHFEELPPGSTLIFYRYCDHENAPYKNVLLIFTVMLYAEVPSSVSLSRVEDMVYDHLKQKFVSFHKTDTFNRIDVDKLSGLWSRISHIILPVSAEKKIENYGCGDCGV